MARQKRQHTKQPIGDRPSMSRTDIAEAGTQRTGDGVEVGDRVRAKTTARTGEVTHVAHDGDHQQLTVAYDHEPQDEYLTTPARDGADFPRELVERVDANGETIRVT
jgi:hypothetical protein